MGNDCTEITVRLHSQPMSKFWNEKIRLRLDGKIPKVWSVEDLYTHLDGIFARGTLTMFPL
jgi:hypothetical protein